MASRLARVEVPVAAGVYSLIVLALAGAVHCAGMCGPFALALGWRREGRAPAAARMALYVLGKCAAYVLLALVFALGAAAVSTEVSADGGAATRGHELHFARRVLAWVAGAVMVLVGLNTLGLAPRVGGGLARLAHAPFAAAWRAARALPPLASALALGLINGCLPCGLSWSAVLLSASLGGALLVVGPLAFGLATAPALIAVASGGALAPERWRARLARVAAVGMVLFGAWTAWRGGLPLPGDAGNIVPPCCASEHAARDR